MGNNLTMILKPRRRGELQYIKVDDLKEKDGLVDDLIKGRKYVQR